MILDLTDREFRALIAALDAQINFLVDGLANVRVDSPHYSPRVHEAARSLLLEYQALLIKVGEQLESHSRKRGFH